MYRKTGERQEFTVLTDEGGDVIVAEFLELVRFEGDEYAVMLEKGADEVLIFRYAELGGGEYYAPVDDDSVLDAVFEAFKVISEDEFDFGGD